MSILKLNRRIEQSVVCEPRTDNPGALTIRVLEFTPGSVGLGFDGPDYKVTRTEIYGDGYSRGDGRHDRTTK